KSTTMSSSRRTSPARQRRTVRVFALLVLFATWLEPRYWSLILCLPDLRRGRVIVSLPRWLFLRVTVFSRFVPSSTRTLPVGRETPLTLTRAVTFALAGHVTDVFASFTVTWGLLLAILTFAELAEDGAG